MTLPGDVNQIRDVPSWIYADERVLRAERDLVFAQTWNFLAHESEIPEPGDFVVRYIADDSIIVARNDSGEINAFLNVCRHRGMQVCRADLGNTKSFTCPYHGWKYDRSGHLVGVPLNKPYFGEDGIDRADYPLQRIARVDRVDGFIFGTLSSDIGSLTEYLGDFAWYLAIHTQRDPLGLEVVGEPQRWIVKGNWKSGAENAMGDSYHAHSTHRSVMEIGVHPNSVSDFQGRGSRNGVHVDAGRGTFAFARQDPAARGYPADLVRRFRQSLPPAQRTLVFDHGPIWPTRAALFPNLMLLNAAAYVAPGHLVPFLFCRVWRPVGSDEIEVWNWILVERSAAKEFKADTQRAYLMTFGPAGMEEQDDAENFYNVSRAGRGNASRKIDQVLRMNGDLDDSTRLSTADWPAPGTAFASTYTDAGNRRFAHLWNDAMRPWLERNSP